MSNFCVYKENGYKDRADYLKQLSEEHGEDVVSALSSLYGPEEDFDGLVTALQDAEAYGL